MNETAALGWLYNTQLFGVKLGLENMRSLVSRLGLTKPAPLVLHVAGTNGKGSVCAFADSLAREAGWRTGLYTSPHLVSFNERIRIDGVPVDLERIAKRLTEIREIAEIMDPHPTFFEITTALAWSLFEEEKLHLAIIETGLGGRLDATNVIPADVSVITRIGLDHMAQLGHSHEAIAAEKAGIFKPGIPAFSASQISGVRAVLQDHAAKCGLDLEFEPELPPSEFPCGLAGSHQAENAALALAALRSLGCELAAYQLAAGLARVSLPGRFQRVGERFVIDGAHNPDAAQRLVQTWREIFGEEKATLIFGVLADKDWQSVLKNLLPLAAGIYCVPVQNPRSAPATLTAAWICEHHPDGPAPVECENLAFALKTIPLDSPSPRVLIAGSLFLAGEAIEALCGTVSGRLSGWAQ